MISFKKNLDKLDQEHQLFCTALDCYLSAMSSMQKHAVEIQPEATKEHRETLAGLERAIKTDPAPQTLENSRLMLESEIRDYRDKVVSHYEKKEQDLKEIILLLGAAADALGVNNENYNTRLSGFTQQLQLVVRGNDLTAMRRGLAREIVELRACVTSMWKDNQKSVSQLQGQIKTFQERLDTAEKLAATDSLTGILNRREGEMKLEQKAGAGDTFCAIVLDLDRFKRINDRWGHSCADQVLRIFSKRLEQLVRPCDTVCRWGGDEFVVIMQGGLATALERAPRLSEKLGGYYTVVSLGKQFSVEVSASMGVAEYMAGETPEQLFTRADADLYKQKEKKQNSHPDNAAKLSLVPKVALRA